VAERSLATCSAADCSGVPLRAEGSCLAHAPPDNRDEALRRLKAGGQLDFTRGVSIDSDLLARILEAAPLDGDGNPILRGAVFRGARFASEADFSGTTFEGAADFSGATFEGDAVLRATFKGWVDFTGATFKGAADFAKRWDRPVAGAPDIFEAGARATFEGDADFSQVSFEANADFASLTFEHITHFSGARFKGYADFFHATFNSIANFPSATFEQFAGFTWATFGHFVDFARATFDDDANFSGATFEGKADFTGAVFRALRQMGPMTVKGCFDISMAEFQARIGITTSCSELAAVGSRFPAGGHLRVGAAEISLSDAEIPAPFILSPPSTQEKGAPGIQSTSASTAPPRVVSVERAVVSGLVLSGVDLRACRFAGAHELDQLRIEERDLGTGSFLSAPPRRSRRRVLFEELEWRRTRRWSRRLGERSPWSSIGPASVLTALQPAEIAGLYRALRRSRETRGDEPGAADFYYGEMEMRRHATTRRPAERAILFLYWLASGYGLRAWRSLTLLAVLLALSTVLIANGGFPAARPTTISGTLSGGQVDLRVTPYPGAAVAAPGHRYTDALWTSLSAAVLRAADQPLTTKGERVRTLVHYFGPILLGLSVLALRGRIKR
jgi:uncharacterized protein YjbI with pentapeptide repeats